MRKLVIVGVAVLLSGVLSAKVLGKINGYPIVERDANAFLKVVTKGKLKYHQLRPKDKVDVVKRIAVDSLLIGMAKKSLPQKEINQVIVNYWLSKKIKNVTLKSEDVRKAYDENKKIFKDPEGGGILPFEKVEEMIKVSLKQKKYVAQLMKKAKITMGKKVIQAPKTSGKKKPSDKKSIKNNSTYKGKTTTYVVKSGNTLSGIAHKHHITTKMLREMNRMTEKDTLKIGQKLKVPKK
jgi:LysM repeat protein